MASALPLRAALVRGALITAANWPVVLIEFILESLYKLCLAVPIVGGAFMVAILLGMDLRVLFSGSLGDAAEVVADSLTSAPAALASFVLAIALVAIGGAALMFVVKSGTLAVLVAADQKSGEIQSRPIAVHAIRRASAYDPAIVIDRTRRFGRRFLTLTVWLSIAYATVLAAYVAAAASALRLAESAWSPLWPIVVVLATCTGFVSVALVNLGWDLLRVIVVTDDCDVMTAAGRLRRFVVHDARHVLGIFGVMGALLVVRTVASVWTTAGLTLVAWVPIAGLISLPLRAAAWLVQGLLFHFVALAAVSAYQTQYRRFAAVPGPVPATSKLLEQA